MPALTLDALHREARELERAHRRGDPDALARVAPFRPDPAKPLKDAGALLVIARERGFPTWVKLQAYVERLDLGGEGLEHAFHDRHGVLRGARRRAARLGAGPDAERRRGVRGRARGDDAGGRARGRRATPWLCQLVGAAPPRRRAWPRAASRSRGPTARWRSGRHDDLAALLGQFPELATARGTNGNALINMAGDAETLRLLLDAGADVAHPNAHGWTPLHQAAYGNRGDLAALLLDAGAPADVSARGAGGTPLIVALFWGHREVVDGVLLERRPPPGQPARRGGHRRPGHDRRDGVGRRRRQRGGGRIARLLPAARRLPGVGSGRRPAGDRRRGAVVGRARRSGRGALAAGRARRADRRRRLPRHRADLGGGQRPRGGGRARWSRWAPTSTPAPPSAARATARASPRCTSPRRPGRRRPSRRCWRPAPTRRCATRSTTARRRAGRSRAGTPRWPALLREREG